MTQLLLEIHHRRDLDLLLDFVERLNIRIVEKNEAGSIEIFPGENELPAPAAAHPVVKPLRKKLRIADLKKEQKYKGMNQARLDKLIDEIDIQEPVELLLAQLKA